MQPLSTTRENSDAFRFENQSPPPPSELGEAAADKPQPKGKEKRPWNKPQLKVIEVNFTRTGFSSNPISDEVNDGDGDVGPPGATYRAS